MFPLFPPPQAAFNHKRTAKLFFGTNQRFVPASFPAAAGGIIVCIISPHAAV